MVKYRAFSCSARGASHAKTDKPCQDYSAHFACDDFAIAIVADGHGSDAHFRSDRGSRFAVEAAMQLLKKVLPEWIAKGEMNFDWFDHPAYSEMNMQYVLIPDLIEGIVLEWNEKVENDWNNDTPEITEENAEFLMWPPSVYGTTLMAVVVTADCWFAIQIGDGKCVAMDSDGNFEQPIPWDDDCYLNVTTSLCDPDAVSKFRIHWEAYIPRAIFLGTDGIDDSYPVHENEKHLAALYHEIYKNFEREGFDEGLKQLEEFLPILTQKGSGDDVSIAGILMETK